MLQIFGNSPLVLLIHHVVLVFGFFLGFILLSHLLVERRAPSSTLAWILAIVFIPYLGIPLYLTLGGRKIRRLKKSKSSLYQKHSLTATEHHLPASARLLAGCGVPPPRKGNSVTLVSNGEQAFKEIQNWIETSRKSIDIATFILGNDDVGSRIVEILAKKAREGVTVRLLVDALGSFWMPSAWKKRITDAGGKFAVFMPMLHVPFRGYSNLRNHRKMIIVDGLKAMMGGMNLAHEYIGPTEDPKRWHDLALSIEGPAVDDISHIFESDWTFASKSSEPPLESNCIERGEVELQVLGSGPDVEDDPLYDTFLYEVFNAKRRVWLTTPYLVPDESLARGLELAARRGVDVKILLPLKSNHRLADFARAGFVRQIQSGGGKFLYFTPTMVHAKATLIDDHYAIVGSANLDIRSLFLNYEIAALIYSEKTVQELEKWFLDLSRHCVETVPKEGYFRDLVEGAARILSPLL